jgi:NADPH:quinone reductase-like Zn-dependent oxidoreductase
LKELGAEEVFDYKDPNCAKKIREYSDNSLTLAMDCIAEGDSPRICEEAISSKGGVISYLLSANHSRKDVENRHTLGYTVFGEAFDKFGRHFDGKVEDFEHTKKFWEVTQKLVDAKQLRTHPTKVGKDGLMGAFDGFQQFRDNKVSGVKLVYRVEETP